MNNTGTILKLKKSTAVIMTDKCDFVTIKRRPGMFIGKQVHFPTSEIRKPVKNIIRYTSSIAAGIAAVLIIIITYYNFNYSNNIYAYVDVDINPSVEFVIDKQNTVLQTTPLNDDTESLLKESKYKGLTFRDALLLFIDKSKEHGFLNSERNNTILITASLNEKGREYRENRTREEENLSEILISFERTVSSRDDDEISTRIITVSPEVKRQADRNNLSMGRQALYIRAIEQNVNVTVEEIRTAPVSEVIDRVHINDSNDNKETPNDYERTSTDDTSDEEGKESINVRDNTSTVDSSEENNNEISTERNEYNIREITSRPDPQSDVDTDSETDSEERTTTDPSQTVETDSERRTTTR